MKTVVRCATIAVHGTRLFSLCRIERDKQKEPFGSRRIDRVKLSDAKCWLIQLQQNGRSYSSIHSIRGVVRPAFQMAVDDDLIRKNPFDFQLATVVVNDSGTRTLPMTEDVYECFARILENRPTAKVEPLIDGKSGFLYLDKNGMPMVSLHWEKYFQHICEKYNKIYRVPMPSVTPHVCRHT